MDFSSKSVEMNNLAKAAYQLLKKQIICGELKQGTVISISAMAKASNISRTPLTYACQKLENERLLTIVPKQGVVINPITVIDAREIYESRAAVEYYSALRTFPYIVDRDIESLYQSYLRQVEYVNEHDIEGFMTEDLNFHKYLLSIQENSQFIRMIDNLWDKAYMLGVTSCKNKKRLEESLREHLDIIDALKNKDCQAFVLAVERNILNGFSSLTGDNL